MATRLSRYRAAAPVLVEQRQASRLYVAVTRATVRTLGEAPVEAVLHDVSAFGCRLGAVDAMNAGERLWLRLAGGMPVAATVMWQDADIIGCRFDEPLSRAMLRQLTLGWG
jgi:hypothetical protein